MWLNNLVKDFLKKYSQRLHYALPFITSVLVFVAFAKTLFSWVVFIALVPYLFFLSQESKKQKPRIALVTWLTGLFMMLLATGWMAHISTRGWLDLEGPSLAFVIFIVWAILGLTLSVGFVLFGIVTQYLIKKVNFVYLSLALVPSLWVLCEFTRSILVSLIAYGEGGTIGANFTFGTLGYAASSTEVGILSRSLGLYGMSLLAVLVNVLIFWLLNKKVRLGLTGLAIIATVSTIFIVTSSPGKSEYINVGVVQLGSYENDYFEPLADLIESDLKKDERLDALVLPEYSSFLDKENSDQAKKILKTAFGGHDGLVVFTTKGGENSGVPTNEIVVSDQNGNIVSKQQKSFLIPTGEYMPWIIEKILSATGHQYLISDFDTNVATSKSKTREAPTGNNKLQLGILACSGVIQPYLYGDMTRAGAEVLVNTASLNQFRTAALYHEQARQFARFQAIANDRPFVQSARSGYSFVLDSEGKTILDFKQPGLNFGAIKVAPQQKKTLYTQVGEWTLALAGLTTLLFIYKAGRPSK